MRRQGFTIVELLTVMGVIAILIGLLVPALNQVKDYAKQIQQGAQFHSIEVALDLYKAEFGEYPASSDNLDEYNPANNAVVRINGNPITDTNYYCGANKLAEALVGLDFLGFHPKSQFWSTGEGKVVNLQTGQEQFVQVYDAVNGIPAINQTADENVRPAGARPAARSLSWKTPTPSGCRMCTTTCQASTRTAWCSVTCMPARAMP